MSARGHGCRGALFSVVQFDGARPLDTSSFATRASSVILGCVFVSEVVPRLGASTFLVSLNRSEEPNTMALRSHPSSIAAASWWLVLRSVSLFMSEQPHIACFFDQLFGRWRR